MKLHFPKPFKHRHPAVESTNELFEAQLTTSQRAADWLAALMGSWKFLITQSVILGIWAGLNVTAWLHHWDPYPFILLNLMLSIQAAYAAPIIMMSQNRQAARDHLEAHNDYVVNQKAEGTDDWFFPQKQQQLLIIVGLDVTPFEEAIRSDIQTTVILSVVMLLLGFGGIISLLHTCRLPWLSDNHCPYNLIS